MPKWVIITVVLVVLILIVGSFASALIARKVSQTISEEMIKAGTNGKIEIDTNSGAVKLKNDNESLEAGTAKWPPDLPENLPVFPAGKIVAAVKSGGSTPVWSVIIKNITKAQVDAYQQQLLSNGWTSDSKVDILVNMVQLTKGDYRITLVFDASSDGVQITVSRK